MRAVLKWLGRHRAFAVVVIGLAGAVARVTSRTGAAPRLLPPAPQRVEPSAPAAGAAPPEPVPTDRIQPTPPRVVPEQREPGRGTSAAMRPGAHAGSMQSLEDGSAPSAEYTIKGNAGSMRCHGPESPYYARTKATVWFRTEAEAEAAGFKPWRPGGQRS